MQTLEDTDLNNKLSQTFSWSPVLLSQLSTFLLENARYSKFLSIFQNKTNRMLLQNPFLTASIVSPDVGIKGDLGWRLWGNWCPINWSKGFIRDKNCFGSIPWALEGLAPLYPRSPWILWFEATILVVPVNTISQCQIPKCLLYGLLSIGVCVSIVIESLSAAMLWMKHMRCSFMKYSQLFLPRAGPFGALDTYCWVRQKRAKALSGPSTPKHTSMIATAHINCHIKPPRSPWNRSHHSQDSRSGTTASKRLGKTKHFGGWNCWKAPGSVWFYKSKMSNFHHHGSYMLWQKLYVLTGLIKFPERL